MFLQNAYGTCEGGVARLPSLQKWLAEKHPSIQLIIDCVEGGGAYRRSVLILHDAIQVLQKVEGAPRFFSTDFCHQYTQYGGYGNVWGLVTGDPDGLSFCFAVFQLNCFF